MNEQGVLEIAANSVWLCMLIAAPSLLAALIIGLVVSIFQAATQINEQTLSFIPKVVGMLITMLIFGPWMLQKLMGFTISLFKEIPSIVN